MAIPIREKRKVIVSNKIITPTIVRRLGAIIDSEASLITREEYFLNYSIEARDGSSYESSEVGIFAEGELIETKSIWQVQMRLQSVTNSKHIEIQVRHADKSTNDSYIIIGGDDSTWVNGCLTRLQEIVASAEKQVSVSDNQLALAANGVTLFLIVYYFRIFWPFIEKVNNDTLKLSLVLLIPLMFILGIDKLKGTFRAIWPAMELQTGPSYQQQPLKKRRKLNWLLLVVVMPIVTAVIYDLLKSVLHVF